MDTRSAGEIESILIVEDEAILRFDMVEFFEDRGWQVFEAADTSQAIEILEAHGEIQAVVTDVQVPGDMDGLKLAHYVRHRFPPTVLYIVSGHAHLHARDLPVDAEFLPKPFNFYSLADRIEERLAA